jgi:hypothetical protein
MLTKLRTRFGAPGVIAVIALVFAMAGGAWAASGGLSGKQKNEVKKIAQTEAKKFATAGPQGPVGLQGAAGAPGAPGKDGSNGSPGVAGKGLVTATELPGEKCPEGGISVEVEGSGTKKFVCDGEEGLQGSPWTLGGKLPSGESEFGTFAAGPLVKEQTAVWVPISFMIPLTAGPSVHYMGAEAAPTIPCPGTFEAPKAKPGNLCVYRSNGFALEFIEEEDPETGITGEGAGKSGANLFFSGEEFQSARGVWVVTAP